MSQPKTIGDIVRKQQTDYIGGVTNISKYVQFSMSETIDTVDAYHNSIHISGKTDALGREKPFFNITIAATNIWYRATDIDRSDIRIGAPTSKDWLNSFLATTLLQEWMKTSRFGQYLNDWGRTMAKYGSAVTKFVDSEDDLNISVIPWSRIYIDPIDFESNPVTELLELTPGQLQDRVVTHGYDKKAVKSLIKEATTTREQLNRNKKDNKSFYIKCYETHGLLSQELLTGKEKDRYTYVNQMHVISFIGNSDAGETKFKDFTLVAGEEEKSPYQLDSLINEDGRSLGKGAVEHLFESQWMVNDSKKKTKDNLDLSGKIIFQTSDQAFGGRNAMNEIETGDILYNNGSPITEVSNSSRDVTSMENYAASWKQLGNEITNVSEAMLGVAPKSGTAWRQTEATLNESHSLFELMIENKGLAIDDKLRIHILPFLKTKLNTNKEITAVLSQFDINKLDRIYIKEKAIRMVNETLTEKILNGETIEEGETDRLIAENTSAIKEGLTRLDNKRFFAPSEINWKKQLEGFEWEADINITGENKNMRDIMATLNTALQTVMNPEFSKNKNAQAIVGKILEQTGTFSPVEFDSIQTNNENEAIKGIEERLAAQEATKAPVTTPPVQNEVPNITTNVENT